MEVYRITHRKWSNKLAASGFPARWNSAGIFMIYTACSRSLACLESVVHRGSSDFVIPFILMEITIPDELEILEISVSDLPEGWNRNGDPGYRKCQQFGDDWITENRSAVLKVPSAIIPKESNFLINQNHTDFKKISIKSQEPFIFDDRIKR